MLKTNGNKNRKNGRVYEIPTGLEEDVFYGIMYDLMDYIKEKRLTIRQARILLRNCDDMLLDTIPENN